MDGYPRGALEHNVPLIVASGLGGAITGELLDGSLKEQGVQIHSQLPPLDGREADVLKDYFDEVASRGSSWTAIAKEEAYRFRVKTVGRSFILPARRARLPDSAETLGSTPILHSPFSPLSPSSALYPDGLIDAQWIRKHQELVPSILACFYSFTSDPSSAALQDNHLKADINDTKAALAKSGFKTRLMLVLFGDGEGGSGALSDGVQERLELIRKGTASDPKSIFYIPPQESPRDLRQVMDDILSIFYSTSIEYYRDLGRHAKKKRSRGIVPQPSVPPSSGTSRTLSLPDWNFRYDFKAAILAEFRQEADAAIKSFEQAYEILLGQEVWDTIPSWSPRWNEARLLSDIISIRCMRLHFWLGQTSLAVRRWQNHRDRIAEFVDRRGMGTNNYGWQAWEARWAFVMATLIERVDVPGLAPSNMTLFLEPEKFLMADRLQPWELLHHTGYWYRLSARHLAARRTLAQQIPEEDRQPPESTATRQAASKSYTYDTYMCPEPHQEFPLAGTGVNHAQLIADRLVAARSQFEARKQFRMVAELSLECAREMASIKSWKYVLGLLLPLWESMSFRSEEWLDSSEDLGWLLRQAAVETGKADLVIAIDWELMNRKYMQRKGWHYDLTKSLASMSISDKPSVSLSDETATSFISATFSFRTKESKAGETCTAQLSLTSNAFPASLPFVLSSVRVEFEGSVKPIILEHAAADETSSGRLRIEAMQLKEEFPPDSESDLPTELRSNCDLTLRPGQTSVFEMTIPLREAGEATASSALLCYQNGDFNLEYNLKFHETDRTVGWYAKGSSKARLARAGAETLQISPRPPKLQITMLGSLEQYYANEPIEMRVELLNAEEESATVKLDVHLFGKEVPAFRVKGGSQERAAEGAPEEVSILGLSVGKISSESSTNMTVLIDPVSGPTTFDVHLRASYHLESDATTPIMQMLTYQLNVVNAFEANYDLLPRLHSDPWPSLFDYESIRDEAKDDDPPRGFAQKWCLKCHYASFANEDITITGMAMKVLSCVGGAQSSVVDEPEVPAEGIDVAPKTMQEAQFGLVAHKVSLDDRQPVSLDLAFIIKWRRQGAASSVADNTTTMLVGKYLVLGTEPRVLASVFHGPAEASHMMQLDITIENPSNHFLTFGLSMDPSDEFAFSGAKQTTLHLLPMSRRTATYRMVPLARGRYARPKLVVRDKYFQKVLRIIPTEGMKIDKEGLLVWVPGDGGEREEDDDGGDGEPGEEDEEQEEARDGSAV